MCHHIKLILIASFIMSNAEASIRRVGYPNPNVLPNVDYATFYAAYGASSSGDTILVWPDVDINKGWPGNYGTGMQITKKLILISKGYWLDGQSNPKGNSGLQTGSGTAYSEVNYLFLDFKPGSSGSVLMGFRDMRVSISENNITIRRNYNVSIEFGYISNISNLLVEGNYKVYFGGTNNESYSCSNFIIRNNLIYFFHNLPQRIYTGGILAHNNMTWDGTLPGTNGGATTMSITASTSTYRPINLQGGYWIFENNLLVSLTNLSVPSNAVFYPINATNTIFNYNVAIQGADFTAFPPNGIGNLALNPSRAGDIFEAFPAIGTSSADGRYRLKNNSPAKAGSAERPTAIADAGMFGGANAYKLGMIPSIPTIYEISSPQGNNPTGNTIQINISTRSNN